MNFFRKIWLPKTETILQEASKLLRDRKKWPRGFYTWNYKHTECCAIALITKAFGYRALLKIKKTLSYDDYSNIFYHAGMNRNIPSEYVTPEMVADTIDFYLRCAQMKRSF